MAHAETPNISVLCSEKSNNFKQPPPPSTLLLSHMSSAGGHKTENQRKIRQFGPHTGCRRREGQGREEQQLPDTRADYPVFVVFCATGCVEVESCGSVTFRPWVTWRGLSPRWFAVVSVVEEWKSAEESRHSCREVFRGCLLLLWAPKVEVRSISVFVEVFNT